MPSRVPAAGENLVAAVEVFAATFRFNPSKVEATLAAWLKSEEDGVGGGVNVTTAAIRRVGGGMAEFRDKYQQFDNVRVPVEDVNVILTQLLEAVKSHRV